MIHYQKPQYADLSGEWLAEITSIVPEQNQFYDPKKAGSPEYVLTIEFDLIDKVSFERTKLVQRFVRPTTFDDGLFQQLLDVYGFGPEEEGGEFDEQELVGMKTMLTVVNNEKGFPRVESAGKAPKNVVVSLTKHEKAAQDQVEDDLPFPEDEQQ